MSGKPRLYCVWNKDWAPTMPRTTLSDNPLFAPGTLMGAVYENALLREAGLIPDGPLPPEAMALFKEQVKALDHG